MSSTPRLFLSRRPTGYTLSRQPSFSSSITVLSAWGSSTEVTYPLGLFITIYTLRSLRMMFPLKRTSSCCDTLAPSSVTTSPLTETTPDWMNSSASRREQIPDMAI